MKMLCHRPSVLVLLAVLAALPAPTARGQDPQEYPGLLVVSAPPEEAGEFIAGVCALDDCSRPPPEGTGPYRLVPVQDPGYPDLDPPIPPDRGCTTFTNADEIEGHFALIRAGGCDFLSKFSNALWAGALGVVLYPDESVGPDDDSTLVNIEWEAAIILPQYGLFISRYRGERLLAAYKAGEEVVAEMRMNPVVAAEPPAEAQRFALTVTPNPARGEAVVRVEAAHPVAAARVSVYDGLGRAVAVLYAGPLAAGSSAFRLAGSGLTGGVYLVRLVAGEAVAVSRVVVLR